MISVLREKNTVYILAIITISLFLRVIFLGNYDLFAEEAYYWNYSTHLDFGYLDHPPMVAVLIKFSTALFGINEFGVRFPSLICWFITVYFSYKLTELIQKGSGIFAVMLLSILPFFFMYSLLITPDLPLMACWSATLYYLYQAICLNRARAWYFAGIAVGLGLISKYSIVLLLLATFVYLITTPKARFWFARKEPYLASILMVILFMPVIYWNATNEWMSFAFQSTRRFQSTFNFSFHELLGLMLVFLTPMGVVGLINLFKKQATINIDLAPSTQHFFQIYTLTPFAIFAFFSLSHDIKCNWIGPGTLAIIPWLAILTQAKIAPIRHWLATAILLFMFYAATLCCITFGTPELINRTLFNKHIAWDDLTQQIDTIAQNIHTQGKKPLLIPLDSYSIASELSFYQAKQLKHDIALKTYPVRGAGFFGYNSLMFDFWSRKNTLTGSTVILIAKEEAPLNTQFILEKTTPLSPAMLLWAHSQGKNIDLKPYYYRIVRVL